MAIQLLVPAVKILEINPVKLALSILKFLKSFSTFVVCVITGAAKSVNVIG